MQALNLERYRMCRGLLHTVNRALVDSQKCTIDLESLATRAGKVISISTIDGVEARNGHCSVLGQGSGTSMATWTNISNILQIHPMIKTQR